MAGHLVDNLFRRFYAGRPGFVDGTTRFHRLCEARIPAGSRLLEIGAGPSNETSRLLAKVGSLSIVDVSDEVLANDAADDARVYDGLTLPYASGTFDACISNYLLEHVTDPESHFAEVARVLKPGGVYIVRTPNLLHYVASVSRLLPHSMHVGIANRLRGLPENAHDPWPTVYRANRPPVLRRLAAGAGLVTDTCVTIECEPSYARGSVFLFFPMMMYERIVNSTDVLSHFRASVNAVFRKP